MQRPESQILWATLLLATLTACGGKIESEDPSTGSATPNADRCEILDPNNCMLPWPSNAFTVADASSATGLRINLAQASLPANKQGVRVDPSEWNHNDGLSPSQMLLVQIPDLDLGRSAIPPIGDLERSLQADSGLVVINADTGEQHLVFGELDVNTDDPAEKTFIVRPMQQFERGGHYIVALRELRNSAGELLPQPEVFRVFRDQLASSNPAIAARRESMAALFDTLAEVDAFNSGICCKLLSAGLSLP